MGENFDRLASTNTAGLIVDLYTLDDNGNDDELVLRSNRDWRCVHYPETLPGFTAGHIIRLLLEQAQADGELLGWTLLFDDINDANGNPWPVGQQITLPMGLDLLSVLRQLATTHIDFRMDQASRRLIATRIGELGSTTPVADLVDHLETLTSEERG
jgi:hypothetical protein